MIEVKVNGLDYTQLSREEILRNYLKCVKEKEMENIRSYKL